MDKSRKNYQSLGKICSLKLVGSAKTLIEKAKREVPGFKEQYAHNQENFRKILPEYQNGKNQYLKVREINSIVFKLLDLELALFSNTSNQDY